MNQLLHPFFFKIGMLENKNESDVVLVSPFLSPTSSKVKDIDRRIYESPLSSIQVRFGRSAAAGVVTVFSFSIP